MDPATAPFDFSSLSSLDSSSDLLPISPTTRTLLPDDISPLLQKIDTIAQRIADPHCRRVVFFTGAGMSAESGIGTFRGGKGLWSGLTGLIALGYFGTPIGWRLTGGLAWKLYRQYFFREIGLASPNVGHVAIGELKRLGAADVRVITQNVDGLHQRSGGDAGCLSDSEVYEVHGTVRKHKCIRSEHTFEFDEPVTKDIPEVSPRCQHPGCNSRIRPDFVLFTEGLPGKTWNKAVGAIQRLTVNDVFVIIGTSAVVYPAAGLPFNAASVGCMMVEINLQPTNFTSGIRGLKFLRGPAGFVLQTLVRRVRFHMESRGHSFEGDRDDGDGDRDAPGLIEMSVQIEEEEEGEEEELGGEEGEEEEESEEDSTSSSD